MGSQVGNQGNDLIYGLNDKPPARECFFAALQHLLAAFVGLITPPIVVSGALGFDAAATVYLINISLFAAGLTTYIQVRKFGPVGSGLLSLQGTSFAFIGLILSIGFSVKAQGGGQEEILANIFGVAFICSFAVIIFSRFTKLIRKVITPLVSGIVVLLIGLSTIDVGFTDWMGGAYVYQNIPEQFGNPTNIILGGIVLVLILFFNRSKNEFLRMSAIMIGLVTGYIIASFMGLVDFSQLKGLRILNIPKPFQFGFTINWTYVAPMSLLYIITIVETIGDYTATSMNSGEPVEGDIYYKRISDGILGTGVGAALSTCLGAFPPSTFSQNNGVILMTGVASRKVGKYIAVILMILGLFPIIGGIFSIIPNCVLGGATLMIFGTIAVSGIRIISMNTIDRRAVMIIAISLGIGMGVMYKPLSLQFFPEFIQSLFSSAITTGGITAILLNLILPQSFRKQKASDSEDSMKDLI